MGATTFTTTSRGKNAKDAFDAAVRDATARHGTEPYSGTIKEKDGFEEFKLPAGISVSEFVDRAMNLGNGPIGELPDELIRTLAKAREVADEKWGPAACVEVPYSEQEDRTREFVFFGWASC